MGRILILLFCVLVVASCLRLGEPLDESECITGVDAQVDVPGDTNDIRYTTDIAPLISEHCSECHGNSPTQGAFTSYTSRTSVTGSYDLIMERIKLPSSDPRRMPREYSLTTCEIYLLERWSETSGAFQ